MKRILSIAAVILSVLIFLASCGFSRIKVYDDIKVYTVLSSAGESKNGYVFRSQSEHIAFDKQETKRETVYGHELELNYTATIRALGCDYRVKVFHGKEKSYQLSYHEDTGKLVGITASSHDIAITRSEAPLTSEQDFIDYAKTIAKDFINVEGYSVTVVPKDPPKPGTATAYRGDEYIFRKQLCGVDTAECLIVSITPDGAVGEIRHQAVDQFKDFEGITLDEKLMDSAVEKAMNVALPQTSGKVEIEECDYYLMNDGGTLLLYLELVSSVTPIDEEKTTDPADPAYREEARKSVGTVVVVPIAEIRK